MSAEPISDYPAMAWRPRREAALARLQAFLPRAGRAYARDRNADHGPMDRRNVSGLSPYLRRRLLLEEEVLRATLRAHSFGSAQKFVQEVFWRTYFKGHLEQHPGIWKQYTEDLAALRHELKADGALNDAYRRAVTGRAGVEGFDDWARELVEYGYLHNHARMWFASIWIFTLGLPWQLGADFFLRHLIDGDPASNTLGWRWVAGLHSRGKNYVARTRNIAAFTDGRFAPENLAADPAPLVESRRFERTGLPQPDPLPEGEPHLLLVTEEDGSPETLPLACEPAAVVGLPPCAGDDDWPVDEKVTAFARGAIEDAVARAAGRFGVAGSMVDVPDPAAALAAQTRTLGVRTVVCAHAPAGLAADSLGGIRSALEREGVRLRTCLRAYDAHAWPHAHKGFFALKAKIPQLLSALDLT